MNCSVREKSNNLKGLGVLEPKKAHDHNYGMVENMQECERPPFQDHDEGVKEFIKLAKVEDI